ncbi:MAG: cation:proton antiporter [Pirellulaceae bacterium]
MLAFLVGPSVLSLVPHDHLEVFDPLLKLAMALVLFNLGCEFTFTKFRRIARHCLILSASEIFVTLGLVATGLVLFGCPSSMAILLGCLAVATAPATTILVLKEFRSEGPVTESTGFLVAMNNFACIILFELGFLAIQFVQGNHDASLAEQAGNVFLNMIGSVAWGIVGGLAISYGCGFLNAKRWLVLLVATSTFLLGVNETLSIPYMLTFFAMGVTVANTSDYKSQIVEELDHISGLLAVLFFAVHGTELDLGAFIAAGFIGGVYILFRIVGKWLGVYLAARATRQPLEVRYWLGSCLFAQAGAAIALSTIAVNRNPALGKPVQDIILGSVVLFEIIGPLYIRKSLLETGEIPLAQAIHHTTRTPREQVRSLIDRFRAAIRGTSQSFGSTNDLLIGNLLRKTKGIHQSASFDAVIDHIEHSRDNTYPVVNDQAGVVGVIRYPLLSDVMFDQSASQLVRAEDLVSRIDHLLHPDEPASRAFEVFQAETDDCIPVVSRTEPHELLGVVRRSDIVHASITQRRKAKNK